MSYKFSTKDIVELLNIEQDNKIDSFLNNKGHYKINKKEINKDIILYRNTIRTNEDIEISQDSYEYNGIYLNIVLDGLIHHEHSKNTFNADFKKSHTTLSFVTSMEGNSFIKRDTNFKSISMFIKKGFLPESIQESFNKKYSNLVNFSPTSYDVSLLANDIFNSPFYGGLEDIYIQSKALDIVYKELVNLEEHKITSKNKTIKFSGYDKEALFKAKKILMNSVQTPPTISELSKQVKLNEFKLKYGFKLLFGLAPYEMIYEYRMKKAKEMLESSEYNITEISNLIGYKHVQSFSNAFRKKYKISPKDIIKTRTYYY